MSDWKARAQELADELTAKGALRSPAWQRAVAEVPRHELVPSYYEYTAKGWRLADTTSPEGKERWLSRVYSNSALFTLPEGRSSSSQPSLMTRMLEALDIQDGHRVLEIGTGSGYNAALLCHRLGDERVYSVDIEPDLVDLARVRLAALGYRPLLAARHGAQGLAEHAPYDRIIGTCSVPAIPWAWVQQVDLDGLVLADLKIGGTAGNLVLLRRSSADRAEGRFDARYGSFMAMREPDPPATAGARPKRDRRHAQHRTTRLTLRPWEHGVLWLLLHLTGPRQIGYGHGQDPDTGGIGPMFLDGRDGSWCEVDTRADSTGDVWESGPRALWHALEQVHQFWTEAGQPGWERFGLTVTERQQTVWLDKPDGPHRWPL